MMKKVCWIIEASSGIGDVLTFMLECKGYTPILSTRTKDKLLVLNNALNSHKEQQVVSCVVQETASLRTTYALIQLHCGRFERNAFI